MPKHTLAVKSKINDVLTTYLVIFAPIWAVFVVNNGLLDSSLNMLGIHPRTFSVVGITGIVSSWLLHVDFDHAMVNTLVLSSLLLPLVLLEKDASKLLLFLIPASGFATWLIGGPNTIHVGASGLIFAIVGYILISATVAGKFLYILPLVFIAGTQASGFVQSLVPQNNISFAGHFGGLVAGCVVGYFFDRNKT